MKLFGRDTKEIKNATTIGLNDADFFQMMGIDSSTAGSKLSEITYLLV